MHDAARAVLGALTDGSVPGDRPVPAGAVAEAVGISPTAVESAVADLREAGATIAESPSGYRVTALPGYGELAVLAGLDAQFDVEYHDALASTNLRARELAATGATDVVVLADEQTGGRGRRERTWDSPPGGVWMSLVLRPPLPAAQVPLLTLAAAVAVTETAREAGVDAHIKWPNDVLVADAGKTAELGGDAKLAGILTESASADGDVEWVVVGVGLNANVAAADLPPSATSLQAQVGPVDRRVVVQRVLERFDALRRAPEETRSAWRAHAGTLGRRVRVHTPEGVIVGDAVDVTDWGALVVETQGGRQTVTAGDCEHLRPA